MYTNKGGEGDIIIMLDLKNINLALLQIINEIGLICLCLLLVIANKCDKLWL